MVLEAVFIIIFILFFAWFIFDMDVYNIVLSLTVIVVVYGVFFVFAGVFLKVGWNLF